MCEPTTIAYVAAAVIAGVGAYTASENQKDMAQYQSEVAANNKKVAEWQAADAKARGDAQAMQVRRKYAALAGTQRASFAARGLDISEGSADAILTDTEFFGEYDQNTTRANAAREAWGYRVRASNFQGDAAAAKAQADAQNPMLSGAMAGASSYFSSGGTVNAKWFGSGG
jgi:hypothetical protein